MQTNKKASKQTILKQNKKQQQNKNKTNTNKQNQKDYNYMLLPYFRFNLLSLKWQAANCTRWILSFYDNIFEQLKGILTDVE